MTRKEYIKFANMIVKLTRFNNVNKDHLAMLEVTTYEMIEIFKKDNNKFNIEMFKKYINSKQSKLYIC